MKILSWNCCLPPWSFSRKIRIPLIVDIIIKENPDVICLQEVFSSSDAKRISRRFRDNGFSHSSHFRNLLTISRFPICYTRKTEFSAQGCLLSCAILDRLYGKGFQITGIRHAGRNTFIVNTHLLSAYALQGRKHQMHRERQILEMTDFLCDLPGEKIVVGDFNFDPGSTPYNIITGHNYIDIFARNNIMTLHNTRRVDFIFLQDVSQEKIKNSGGIHIHANRFVSDHNPIWIELT